MKKPIAVVIVIMILIITAMILASIWDRQATDDSAITVPAVQNSVPVNTKATADSSSVTAETQAIDSDLNTISDDDFNADQLSDQNVGL